MAVNDNVERDATVDDPHPHDQHGTEGASVTRGAAATPSLPSAPASAASSGGPPSSAGSPLTGWRSS